MISRAHAIADVKNESVKDDLLGDIIAGAQAGDDIEALVSDAKLPFDVELNLGEEIKSKTSLTDEDDTELSAFLAQVMMNLK